MLSKLQTIPRMTTWGLQKLGVGKNNARENKMQLRLKSYKLIWHCYYLHKLIHPISVDSYYIICVATWGVMHFKILLYRKKIKRESKEAETKHTNTRINECIKSNLRCFRENDTYMGLGLRSFHWAKWTQVSVTCCVRTYRYRVSQSSHHRDVGWA